MMEEWVKTAGQPLESGDMFGDRMKDRDGCLRVVYNNVNGLQIKEFCSEKFSS